MVEQKLDTELNVKIRLDQWGDKRCEGWKRN